MLKQHEKILLASASPRRKELLTSVGLSFRIQPSGIVEVGYGGAPEKVPSRIVLQKMKSAKAQMGMNLEGYILVADTVVALGQEVFGKPENAKHAQAMLEQLSGKTHQVYTCFRVEGLEGNFVEKTVRTDVHMRKLTSQMIHGYIQSGEPFDKAGGYAIQGLGGVFVESIQGSYSNVVGLPMAEVVDALMDLKVISFE